jgi:2,3-dihydroxyphenylpropionate 1,2-dioxygenase
MPETEGQKNVEHVREVAADIGQSCGPYSPISGSSSPTITLSSSSTTQPAVHRSCRRRGHRRIRRQIPLEDPERDRFEIVRQLYRQNLTRPSPTAKIDYAIGIPLTHLGHTDPVLPISRTYHRRRSPPWSAAMPSARRSRAL